MKRLIGAMWQLYSEAEIMLKHMMITGTWSQLHVTFIEYKRAKFVFSCGQKYWFLHESYCTTFELLTLKRYLAHGFNVNSLILISLLHELESMRVFLHLLFRESLASQIGLYFIQKLRVYYIILRKYCNITLVLYLFHFRCVQTSWILTSYIITENQHQPAMTGL